MWQSHVEIKNYSLAYFNRIATLKVPYCWTFIKGGAHTRFADSLDVHASKNCVWAPSFTEVQWYGISNTAMWSNTQENNLWFLHGTVTHTNVTARGGDMPSSGIKHMYSWWMTGVATRDYDNTGVPWVPQSCSQPPSFVLISIKQGGLEMRLGAPVNLLTLTPRYTAF